MSIVRRKRTRFGAAAVAAVSAIATAGLLAVSGPLSQTASATPTAFDCDGTGTYVQTGLESVSGATLQDRTPIASSGPNLVINGDFTYDDSDNPQNGDEVQNGLTRTVGSPPLFGPGVQLAIKSWAASGGGDQTYAFWGGGLGGASFFGKGAYQAPGASASMVYFGDATNGWYTVTSGTFAFNGDGVGQGDIVLHPDGSAPAGDGSHYGTPETPVQITQTVSGLTPGTAYRLQFWASGEDANQAAGDTQWDRNGVAAVDITGYNRTYFVAPVGPGKRYTIDFIATSADTTIKYSSWGHIDMAGPPGVGNTDGPDDDSYATELILDDVILTECLPGTGPSPDGPPTPTPTPGTNPATDPRFTG